MDFQGDIIEGLVFAGSYIFITRKNMDLLAYDS